MTTNPLDAIQSRFEIADKAQDDYGEGTSTVIRALMRSIQSTGDVPNMVAALRAVEALHRNEARDAYGRPTDEPTGHGGWCYKCGRYDGEGCQEITAIREALG